jgi:glycerol-3-phosphate acyltransferase PlsY
VAASAGLFFLIRWDAALLSFCLFFVVRKCTGYVSLSSIALACAFPLALIGLHPIDAFRDYRWIAAGSGALALLILIKHRTNLVRIKNGVEPKVKKTGGKNA